MASQPDQANGRIILDIYAHFRSQPGDQLVANNFIAVATRKHVRMSEVQNGLNYSSEAGWIENGPDGSLRLTQKGFDTMNRTSD